MNMGTTITEPSQRRPLSFNEALLSASFKKPLLACLKNEWTSDKYAPTLEDHKVHFAPEEICYLYTAKDGHIEHTEVSDLQSTHEEADTRVIFHANYISKKNFLPVIVIRSCDTDVFILLLYHSVHLKAKLWMDTGICSKNTRRNINITELAEILTLELCLAKPTLHAFTGSDYTAAFLRKGKSKPLKLMESNKKYKEAFT